LIGEPFGEGQGFAEMLHQPCRQVAGEFRGNLAAAILLALLAEVGEQVEAGEQVDRDLLALAPVGRELQDGGTGKAAMGEQQRLVEPGTAIGEARGTGDAGETGKAAFGEGERDESGAGCGDAQAELAGDVMGQSGGAHFRDRLAAGGQHEIAAGDGLTDPFAVEVQGKAGVGLAQVAQRGLQPEFGPGAVQLGEQHGDDLFRRAVAKELPQGLFVPCYAVAVHQVDEIPLGIAGQGGFGEMRVFREEVLGARVQVGEVAAAAAGNADFISGRAGVIDQQDTGPGMRGAHQAGGTGAEYDGSKLHAGRVARIAAKGKRKRLA
jgi:hypothetical protein